MNHLLGAILEDEVAAGRLLLTAIVTHKYGDKESGDGFYDMTRTLGFHSTSHSYFGRRRYKGSSHRTVGRSGHNANA